VGAGRRRGHSEQERREQSGPPRFPLSRGGGGGACVLPPGKVGRGGRGRGHPPLPSTQVNAWNARPCPWMGRAGARGPGQAVPGDQRRRTVRRACAPCESHPRATSRPPFIVCVGVHLSGVRGTAHTPTHCPQTSCTGVRRWRAQCAGRQRKVGWGVTHKKTRNRRALPRLKTSHPEHPRPTQHPTPQPGGQRGGCEVTQRRALAFPGHVPGGRRKSGAETGGA